jgi:AcrR family transcriptional regulator|tara:strand:- start:2816 stop:3499 length:684 start_codon:yes stop_codon:yes gene_type:complete
MSETRARNMEKRRQRILDAARAIIVENGVDGLTTRGLAEAAGVTAPTLYNLIGDKDAIIRTMIGDGVERVWAKLDFDSCQTPLDMAEMIIETAYAETLTDQDYYRAVSLATDRVPGAYAARGDLAADHTVAGQRSVDMAAKACRSAIEQGYLAGRISAETLGLEMFISYRGHVRDWAQAIISNEECRRRQLSGFYLVMAADATPEFREVLLGKIEALQTDRAASKTA